MLYFLAPDESRPSGGIQLIYLMVDLLNELGHAARVFHGTPGFRCSWFENDTPVVAQPFLDLRAGDVLVVPEYGGPAERDRCRDARVVVLNQNHFRTFTHTGFGDEMRAPYPGWPNARAVVATSEAITDFVNRALRAPLPVFSARVVVDTMRFAPAPKRRTIAFMPRKRTAEARAVVQLLHRAGLDGWTIVPIQGITHEAAAAVLAEAAIFMSFSSEEGFGLPPAEAMAAGCYVVGYTGDGGREFMDPRWCSPIAEEHLVGFADEVARVARDWEADPARVEQRALEGRAFIAGRYTIENLRDDLGAAFSVVAADDSDARQTRPVRITHWSVPIGPRGSIVRWSRRITQKVEHRLGRAPTEPRR